jgi:antitoxin (DNA-binding transcriptional repressor) of toxin-antitoxin stability system
VSGVTQEESMRELSIREIRAALPQLDRILEQEGELIITRRGEPIARLLPAVRKQTIPRHAELRSRMPRLSVGSEVLIRQERDER